MQAVRKLRQEEDREATDDEVTGLNSISVNAEAG